MTDHTLSLVVLISVLILIWLNDSGRLAALKTYLDDPNNVQPPNYSVQGVLLG